MVLLWRESLACSLNGLSSSVVRKTNATSLMELLQNAKEITSHTVNDSTIVLNKGYFIKKTNISFSFDLVLNKKYHH